MRRLLPLMVVLSAAPSFAGTLYRSGDWKLDENVVNGVSTCVMYTADEFNNVAYQLDIRHVKGQAGLTEVFIKMQGKGAMVWKATNRAGREFGFAHLSTAVVSRKTIETFWNIPSNTAELLVDLENRRDLNIAPADSTRNPRASFSSDGFSKVKQEMEKRCLNNAKLVDTVFESSFLTEKGRSAIGVTPEAVVELRALLTSGHRVYLSQGTNGTDMQALSQRFATQINESAALNANISNLAQLEIPKIQNNQVQNDTLDAQSRQDILRFNNVIPAQSAAVTSATQVRDRAQTILNPLIAEHDQRVEQANYTQSSVDNSVQRINIITSQRATLVEQVRQLRYEAQRAQDSAYNAQTSLQSARQDARQADRMYRDFDITRETMERLRADQAYNAARHALPAAREEAVAAANGEKAARAARDARQQEVNVCRATEGADCAAADVALTAANTALGKAKDDERAAQSRLNTLNNRISSTESSVQRAIESDRSQLSARAVSTQNRVNELEAAIARGQQSANEILSFRIPRAQDQIQALDRELPLVENELARSQPEASRAASDLDAYERRVGWTAKVSALENAKAVLNARANDLAVSRSALSAAESTVTRCANERARLATLLTSKQAALAQAQARLVVVTESLVPFETEKARLEGVRSNLQGELEGLSQQFENLIPNA